MKVLVTGASGRLGAVVCKQLLERGHDVVGTDQRFNKELGVPLRIADLRDSQVLSGLLEGREAVVHLGNIPSLASGSSPQAVLSDNTTTNVNVFRAAADLGVRRIVFASSLQAMVRLEEGRPLEPPYGIPYFPLDGDAPADPGYNFYGLSKELGERVLRVIAERFPELACTSLRFPFLAGDEFLNRITQPLAPSALNLSEGLTHLQFADAARLIGLVLERQKPGYHQYFPAQSLAVMGYSAAQLLAEFFADTPLRRPRAEITSLVDLSALERDLDFRPSAPLTVQLLRP
jgi:nucleoside-diphosphate-sugar epimerase